MRSSLFNQMHKYALLPGTPYERQHNHHGKKCKNG